MYNFRYFTLVLLYLLSCVFFLNNKESLVLVLLGLFIVFISIPYSSKQFFFTLSVLPLSFLLGPIFIIQLGSISLNLSDLLLFFHLIFFVFFFHKSIKLKVSFSLILGSFILIPCTVFSISFSSSLVTITSILQWVIYYILCTHFYVNSDDFLKSLKIWGHAITLGSLLVIISYILGKPLILNTDDNFYEGFKDLKESATQYLRASYFVTSFIFVNACALITYFTLLMLTHQRTLDRLKTILFFLINLFCALLMQNKSVIFAVLIIFTFIMIITLFHKHYRYRVGVTLFLFAFSLIGVYKYAVQLIGESQLEYFIERIYDNESYSIRVPIWINVIEYTFTNPKVLLFGIGPDISIREANLNFFDQLFTYRGLREYAVDSNYFTFLLNYGIILSILFFYKIISILMKSYRGIFKDRVYCYLLIFPVIAWLIISVTQLHGISKPAFLIIYYIAISDKLSLQTISKFS